MVINTSNLRDLILNFLLTAKNGLIPDDIVGLQLKHPEYGQGRVLRSYYARKDTVVIQYKNPPIADEVNLQELFGPDSSWKFSNKQLESMFGHLRQSQLQPKAEPTPANNKLYGLFPWEIEKPQPNPCPKIRKQRISKSKKVGHRSPPKHYSLLKNDQ